MLKFDEEIYGKTWDEYVEEQKELFVVNNIENSRSYIEIKNIPDIDDFYLLMDVLKAKYGSRFAEFLILECGSVTFYYTYQSSGLFSAVEIMKMIRKNFGYDVQNQMNWASSSETIEPGKCVRIHMPKAAKRVFEKWLTDICMNESDFGWRCCASTFSRAKKEFKELIDSKRFSPLSDDFDNGGGYFGSYWGGIKVEIDDQAQKQITNIVSCIPTLSQNIEDDMKTIRRCKECRERVDPKIKSKLYWKTVTLEYAIGVIDKYHSTLPDETIRSDIKHAKDIINKRTEYM